MEKQEGAIFGRVIRYFLDHEKPKDEPKPKRKPVKRPAKKRVSKTKAR